MIDDRPGRYNPNRSPGRGRRRGLSHGPGGQGRRGRGGPDDDAAARGIRRVIDEEIPHISGPFSGLACDLLGALADRGDWLALARWIRYGADESDGLDEDHDD